MAESPFHPDLRLIAKVLPRDGGARMLRAARFLNRVRDAHRRDGIESVRLDDILVRLHSPPVTDGRCPALLWLHGGGYIGGCAAQDDSFCQQLAHKLGILVAAVEYRLSPEHPFPTPLYDSYGALRWLVHRSSVDVDRVAVGGASAGGGLAAALALLARERDEVRIAFQLLSYPMLDDRTVTRLDIDERHVRLWGNRSNAFGWKSYLDASPGSARVSGLAAPARHGDLSGLPPAWIGVGSLDLFFDEDVAYAERLRASGVRCQLDVIEGAFHGFDVVRPRARIAQSYRATQANALRIGLAIDS